jgi:citrate synthase
MSTDTRTLGLRSTLEEKIAAASEDVRALVRDHGDDRLSEVTIAQAYGGMRGVKCMITETSAVDPIEGIRFRGYSIPELRDKLPKAPGGKEPLPEGIFYLLLTGELPTAEDVVEIGAEWRRHEVLPAHARAALDALPLDTHPMTQLSIGILALQHDSLFARRYRAGLDRARYWEVMLEDALRLIGRLPVLAAYIYRRTYKAGVHIPPADSRLDWGGNLAHMLGGVSGAFQELMRLYLSIHADHEGGNVSAHTTHLVGSALSDPYLALSAGMNGLAGPLHGLANQEVMRWIDELKHELGARPTRAQVSASVRDTLGSGRVVPGYGHAVLRRTDPRYTAQREFALAHLPDDENFRIVDLLFEVVPGILQEQGKAKNPWPNVDAHSGCLLVHYGLTEADFFTVLFGVSRALGVLASLVWDRALMLPLERPKSVTTKWLKQSLASS